MKLQRFDIQGRSLLGRYNYLSFKTVSSACETEPYLWTQPATLLFKVLHVYSMGLYSGEYGERKIKVWEYLPAQFCKTSFLWNNVLSMMMTRPFSKQRNNSSSNLFSNTDAFIVPVVYARRHKLDFTVCRNKTQFVPVACRGYECWRRFRAYCTHTDDISVSGCRSHRYIRTVYLYNGKKYKEKWRYCLIQIRIIYHS